MFAAVLLASRLPTSMHVLALITLAIGLFGLYPLALQALHSHSRYSTVVTGSALAVADVLALLQVAPFLAGLLAAVLAGIAFAAPLLLLALRPLKNEIKGPWDIARPHL